MIWDVDQYIIVTRTAFKLLDTKGPLTEAEKLYEAAKARDRARWHQRQERRRSTQS